MTNWITRLNGAPNKEATASGFIANRDAVKSLIEIGFEPLDYFRYDGKNESDDALHSRLDGILAGVKRNDTVIVQYPMWQMDLRFEKRFFAKLKRRPGLKMVALVWDILSWLHDDRDRDYTKDWSLRALNEFDLVIAANRKMAERLKTEGGVTKPILAMDLSDSRYSGPLQAKTDFRKLYFVGRLDKVEFSEYKAKTPLHLIGNIAQDKIANRLELLDAQENLHLIGEVPNAEIPFIFDGGFGVVVYKTSKTTKFAGAEKYGQYNNPLKLSQYLSAGIPVIVDSRSAHADWVKKAGVGFVVDDINEIDELIKDMTMADYQVMLDAVRPWQEAVSTGLFAKRAAMEALRITRLHFTDTLA